MQKRAMRKLTVNLLIIMALFFAVFAWLSRQPSLPDYSIPDDPQAVERGRYLIQAGGCISCHQGENEQTLSGGLALDSDFGIFYASNITPDPDTGIGGWSAQDFVAALKHGRRPDGGFYYPAFPYRSYAGLTDEDVLDIAAYLLAQPAVSHKVQSHDLIPGIGRWQMAFWNRLADLSEVDFAGYSDPELARGAYLARHLGHCGECHTPRNALGIMQLNREFGGGVIDSGNVPAIDAEALEDWTEADFDLLLFLGLTPDEEYMGGKMEDVIEYNTARLSEEDRRAMAAFFIRGLQSTESPE